MGRLWGQWCILLLLASGLTACLRSEVLSPEPSALDLDKQAPVCPGLTGVTVSSGPSLSVTWGEGSDELTTPSDLTYSVFMRTGTNPYDLVSPSKIVIGATSTLISQGIQLGQTYTLYVTCKDEKGNVAPAGPTNEISVTVSDEIPPTPPSNLVVGSPSFTSLLLTWTPADDGPGGTTSSQMKYRIYRASAASVDTTGSPLATLTAATSYNDQSLIPGTTYYYRIVAEDLAGNRSAPSTEASGTTLADVTSPMLVPAIMVKSIANNPGPTSISIEWSAGSDNVTTPGQLVYRVYRCSGSTTCDPYAATYVYETAPGATEYANTALVPNTIYVYGVRARDSSGNLSTNTDRLVTSTAYNSSGTFDVFPSNEEVGILLGRGVAVGNVVGNSFPDLIVGAPNASEPASQFAQTGCIYIFPGTATGVFATTPTQTICQPSPPGNGANARNFGFAIASGDLDGNGTADLVVGSPQQDKLFIFRSTSSDGFLTIGAGSSQIIRAGGTGFAFGLCLGDSDGRGQPDIFAVSPFENCSGGCSGLTGTGNVVIYENQSSGGSFLTPTLATALTPTASLLAAPNNFLLTSNERTVLSCTVGRLDPNAPEQEVMVLGSGVVDHDNNASANDGIVSFYRRPRGSIAAMARATNEVTVTTSAAHGRSVGETVIIAGSTSPSGNAFDGRKTVASVPTDTTFTFSNEGPDETATLATATWAAANVWSYQNTIVAFVNNPPQLRDGRWGDALATVEVDGAGVPELFVGAPNDSSAGTISGAVYGYAVNTLANNFILSDLGDYFYGGSDQNNNWAGTAIASANIWGHAGSRQDLVIGAAYDDRSLFPSATSIDLGDVFTYRNVNGSMSSIIQQQKFDVSSVNARIDNEFGRSLCKGDVNNDGMEDVMIGSPGQSYDPVSLTYSGFQGALYVYYGRASGEIDFANPNQMLFGPGNQGSAGYGYACVVLDYNADGEMDLLVGSPWRDIGPNWDRGAVYVYYGADNSPVPQNPGATLNAPLNVSGLYFGFSLTKGDLDDSGDDDLIVGSPYWDSGANDSGGAWIFWANVDSGAIMPATSVTTIVPPFGNAGTTGNPHLANNVDAGGGGVISGMSRLANVVTVTTSTPHGLVTGRNVGIWGTASPSANDFNGFPRTITVTSTTTFTFSQGGPNESATAAGGGSIATSGRYYNYTQANTFFGYSLATFPTVPNSSGQDLVICAPWRDSGSLDLDGSVGALGDIGTCYVYEGKVNGGLAGNYQVMTVPRNEIRYPGSAATWWGGAQYFGTAVTRGDWDADGRDDLVVCAHRLRKPGPPAVGSAGGCFAFYGRKSPNPVGGFYSGTGYKPNFAGARPSPEADDIYFNPRTTLVGNDFGVSVLLVDVNNNVRQDLMIGEALSENEGGPANLGRNSGRVLVDRGGF